MTTPPGTEAIGRVSAAANMPVLVLLDEVLNFVNRHRGMGDSLFVFLQNLTVATTGTTRAAVVISLPRSQVEMTQLDQEWHDRITKLVRRVARDLIANDEAEIGEVVRRRLFEIIGDERIRKRVSREYADWCFERSARLPAEWMAVDSTATEAKARDFCAAGSRLVTRSIRRLCRCFSASGGRLRNSSRRAARSPCWRNGSRSRQASISIMRDKSR